MRAWARLVVCTMAGAIGCASLAGLEDPAARLDDSAVAPTPPSSSSARPIPSTQPPAPPAPVPDAAAAVDAEVDAGPPVCTLAQEGEACDAMDRCCSGHCREDKKCVTSCAAAGKSCDLLDTKACCVGFFCNGTLFSAHCVGCIASGDAPLKDVFGAARLNSCCSRTTNATGDKCQ